MADVDTSREAVERRAARIERYAEQRKADAVNWAPGSTLAAEVLAHAAVIAGDAATLRALLAEVEALNGRCARYSALLATVTDEINAALARAVAADGEAARMREVLRDWERTGCPDCGGDCASANPPVASCIMRDTRAALASKEPANG